MKPTDLTLSKSVIVEEYFRVADRLVESVCSDLTLSQRQIVEGITRELRPLIEASLSPEQIEQIFTNVETGATAAGSNRTMIGKGVDVVGKGVDVVKKANEIINNIGKWLQDTTPVQAFDAKFEELKNNIATKYQDSKIVQGIEAMSKFAKENPGKTAAIIGVLTAIASLAAGPVGGAIAGQVLRGAGELLKGERVSTAIGKGLKTAAFGFLAGKAVELLGQYAQSLRIQKIPFGPADAGLQRISIGAQSSGPGYFSTIKLPNILVDERMASAIENARVMLNSPDPATRIEGYNNLSNIAKVVMSKDYRMQLNSIIDSAWQETKNNDSLLQWIKGIGKAAQAAAQGTVAAAGSTNKPADSSPKESRKLNIADINRLFETVSRRTLIAEGPLDWLKSAGKNLTTKITADKLRNAWVVNKKPTDSNEIAKILQKAGVSNDIIANTYSSMGVELPADITAPTASVDPGATSTATATAPAATANAAPTSNTTTAANAAPTGNTTTAANAAPTGNTSGTIFDNPAKLEADFNEFVKAGYNIPPAFRGVLKDILSSALKTVESREYKLDILNMKTRIIEAKLKKIKSKK